MHVLALVVDEQTGISIGLTFLIITAVIGAAAVINKRLKSMEDRLATNEQKVVSIETDRYTLSMAVEQALRLAIANPGMHVPDPRDPSKSVTVTSAVIKPCGER